MNIGLAPCFKENSIEAFMQFFAQDISIDRGGDH